MRRILSNIEIAETPEDVFSVNVNFVIYEVAVRSTGELRPGGPPSTNFDE